MTKYIFLDFDGVLNTENYQKELKESGSVTTDRYGYLFDPKATAHLQTIIEKTGAKVCITSSWAIEIGADKLKQFWKDREMPGELIGTTAEIPVDMGAFFDCPDEDFDPYKLLDSGIGARGSEIKAFLAQRGTPNAKYVILDDTADFCKEQQDKFIRINPQIGITECDVEEAISILS